MNTFKVLLVLLICGMPVPVQAQSVFYITRTECWPDADVRTFLKKYHEVRSGAGLSTKPGKSAIVELLVSPSGTWTIIQRNAAGFTCFLDMGKNWMNEPIKINGSPS